MSILDRFKGSEGQKRLEDEISNQSIVRGNQALAQALVSKGTLVEFNIEENLITQGSSANEIYLIVVGVVDIIINYRLITSRTAGQHVGEIAMIDPTTARTATVKAKNHVIALKIKEIDFTYIANQNPNTWRLLARDSAARLRERSRFIKEPNLHPHVFIGSSSENLDAASKLQEIIKSENMTVKLWSEGIFSLTNASIESLYKTATEMDYAILIMGHDDTLIHREDFFSSPRDNVVFELGLFMGTLGPNRTIFIAPKDKDFKIPSDLDGITHIKVECEDGTKKIKSVDIEAAAKQILTYIFKHGVK